MSAKGRGVVAATFAAVLTAGMLTGCGSSASPGGSTPLGVTGGGTVAASSAPAPTIQQQIAAWWVDPTKSDFQAVINDDGAISTALTNGDTAGIAQACGALKDDVVRFEADPAAPDAQLRTDLAQAMDAYSTTATQCLSGDLTAAGDSALQGNAALDRATARMKSFLPGP